MQKLLLFLWLPKISFDLNTEIRVSLNDLEVYLTAKKAKTGTILAPNIILTEYPPRLGMNQIYQYMLCYTCTARKNTINRTENYNNYVHRFSDNEISIY